VARPALDPVGPCVGQRLGQAAFVVHVLRRQPPLQLRKGIAQRSSRRNGPDGVQTTLGGLVLGGRQKRAAPQRELADERRRGLAAQGELGATQRRVA